MTKIAFIGLGNMGLPMAHNLVKSGYDVTGFDLNDDVLQRFESEGGKASCSKNDAVKGVDVVISMLPAGKHVTELFCGSEGLLTTLPKGCLVIDSSTIDAKTAIDVSAFAGKRGIDFIDAPVSGGVNGAAAGSLSFIVGASVENFNKAKPILEIMGNNIFHAGEVGSGQIAKACNNMLLAITMAGTAEAMKMGIESGLDARTLSDIILKCSGANWALEFYNPVPGVLPGTPACNDYQGGFMVNLMNKDLGLAMEVARLNHAKVPMGVKALELFEEHETKGNGNRDFSSIFEYY